MARLLLVNGPPGIGKSTLARRYVDDHPLVLCLEIDAIRTSLGGWEDHDESKLLARSLALVMAEAHLRSGHDVVVPQLLGRVDFINVLDDLAERLKASFVEVLLWDSESVVTERFQVRRAELSATHTPHPQADVHDNAVPVMVTAAMQQLLDVETHRPNTRRVTMRSDPNCSYRALCAVLDGA